MITITNETKFATAVRANPEVVRIQNTAAQELATLHELLTNVPEIVIVLNEERQMVYCNRSLLDLVDGTHEEHVGKRLGEILGCMHCEDEPGGCGTAEACRTCGAVAAILAAVNGEEAQEEVRLTTAGGAHLDLIARSRPLESTNGKLIALSLTDIASEKRRRALERVFFHDVMNTAGGVQGLVGLFEGADADQMAELVGLLKSSAGHLIEEIQSQRMLSAAETRSIAVASTHRRTM